MALDTLSEKELDAIFGENDEVFYNTEIQGPSASKVVNNDANVLSIHPTGHKTYDEETNQLELVNTANNSAALDKVIDRFEEKLNKYVSDKLVGGYDDFFPDSYTDYDNPDIRKISEPMRNEFIDQFMSDNFTGLLNLFERLIEIERKKNGQ